MWGPMGPLVRPQRQPGICCCTCHCRQPATATFMNGPNEWSVCEGCKTELEEALVPWLQ